MIDHKRRDKTGTWKLYAILLANTDDLLTARQYGAGLMTKSKINRRCIDAEEIVAKFLLKLTSGGLD